MEAGRAAQSAREEVIELQMAAQAKDRENAKLWDQVCLFSVITTSAAS